jgi:uncharacterized protein
MNRHPITAASFNLTQKCNLRCSYCFTYGQSAKRMSFDIGKKCIDFLLRDAREADISQMPNKRRQVDIGFWGGEPFLEWALMKNLILYAENQKEKDIMVSFGGTTNGVLLTPDKFSFLKDHNCLFMVSLDGTQETHDKYRKITNGSGSHATIMKNMEQVMKEWPFYKIRMSPYADGIHRFYEDVKYLVEHGILNIMFSPVYESGFTEEHWKVWEYNCYKVVDLIADYRKKGVKVEIEHFKSYMGRDRSEWPCGAGRFYVGFDVDGAIYPCHRFNKFTDKRDWREKEVCIGHVDHGITNFELRNKFIDWHPVGCDGCEFFNSTPCHGGCYAVNFDLTGDLQKPHQDLCRYVKMQKAVSEYYKEKIGMEQGGQARQRSCICYNMCYMEDTKDEIRDIDGADTQCQCYNANYTGPLDQKVARKLEAKTITPIEVMELMRKIDKRLAKVEEYIANLKGREDGI